MRARRIGGCDRESRELESDGVTSTPVDDAGCDDEGCWRALWPVLQLAHRLATEAPATSCIGGARGMCGWRCGARCSVGVDGVRAL